MDVDELFVRTLGDLEQRTAATDEYDVLMSAFPLRKLLMDGQPLMDKVNAGYRLKITFPMNDVSRFEREVHEDEPWYWSLGVAIEQLPDLPPGMVNLIDATRDQFLARRVMRVQGHWVTVRDLIDQLAHVEGAVHAGRPAPGRQEVLQKISRHIYIDGLTADVAQVRSIGRVAVRGLAPLRDAIASPTRTA
jgi:hypothetical protein